MNNIIIAGIGTDVGKTVVASIFVQALAGNYWKPIQCGNLTTCDRSTVKTLADHPDLTIHPEAYRLATPVSPHHAAEIENITLSDNAFSLPSTSLPLIIECAGGLLVPLRDDLLQLDLFAKWKAHWILVSKHYLGSINHTLLTIEALKKRQITLSGIIFNGEENIHSERVILKYSKPRFYARINNESIISSEVIQRYAEKWKAALQRLITSTQ